MFLNRNGFALCLGSFVSWCMLLEVTSAGEKHTPARFSPVEHTTAAEPAVNTRTPVTSANPHSDKTAPARASATEVLGVRPGIPQIHRIHSGLPHGGWGRWWFHFSNTYAGAPPAKPSSGALVIPAVQLQGVYLGSAFASTNSATVTTLEAYLSFLATSTYLSELSAPYGTSTGSVVKGQVINVALPQYSATSTYLLDSDIVSYLTTNINNSKLTAPKADTVYVVYVEPGVAVDAGGGSTSINAFLGYHNTAQVTLTSGTATIYYAVIPYPGSPNPTPASQGFANVNDELTAVTSHEVAESVTDPDTTNGWQETVKETISLRFFGWTLFSFTQSLSGEEIGDVPLLLNNSGSQCYARYSSNSYLVQQLIAADGVTMLTPTGATPLKAAAATTASHVDADGDVFGFMRLGFGLH